MFEDGTQEVFNKVSKIPIQDHSSNWASILLPQILGKKDILATLHPGAPEAESSSLGKETRKSLGVLHSLGAKAHAEAQESIQGGRGEATNLI